MLTALCDVLSVQYVKYSVLYVKYSAVYCLYNTVQSIVRTRRYFQHAHFIPIVGVGKRGAF